MKIIIMAGGRGSRITSVNSEVPKPMIPILNKPILEYQIEVLRSQGYTDITLITGHLGYIIKDYFGDGSCTSPVTGRVFGVNISYITEEEPLGTAGALYLMKDEIKDDFLMINGDIIFDIDIKRLLQYHKEKDGLATILTHPNNHPYDSGIVIADESGQVCNWLHKEDERLWYQNRVNAGIHLLSPDIFKDTNKLGLFTELKTVDLDREVLKPLIPFGQLFAYDSPEYVKDMGTPDRFYSVYEDIKSGRVKEKNLSNKQKAVFLDRDGTLNKYVGFLTNIVEFELIDGVIDAIKKINQSGYLAIVITNQPVIARGELELNELQEIHNKLETLLGQQGAYLDAIYYCPHHPHGGYEGERIQYKIECNCRKPKPGMILAAAEKYNIDLKQSIMIGDSISDVKAGKNAGCNVAYLGEEKLKGVEVFASLKDCIDSVLNE